MLSQNKTFSILITTKNRITDLQFTLSKIQYLLDRNDVECIICDDGSSDGTTLFLETNYPKIQLIRNEKSKGLIYSRNKLMSMVTAEFAISIDDDLHFITLQPLELIEDEFRKNPSAAVLSFRIYWSLQSIKELNTPPELISEPVNSFAGGANAWRMTDWKESNFYPEWFVFYGEEDYASYNLFKQNKQVIYFPSVLTHHRVNLKDRKKHKDYITRTRRSLRAGWFLYFMFVPVSILWRKIGYSIYWQLKSKTAKGDFKATVGLVLAAVDFLLFLPKLILNKNRLTTHEYKKYSDLKTIPLYWSPKHE